MTRILTVIGTRPQYIKYAAIAAAGPLPWEEILVDTGQHYDAALARAFFKEYALPRPRHTLDSGDSTGLPRLGSLLQQLDPLCAEHTPDALLCFGDTDSTLAAALAGARHGIPVLHVEAGERSRDREGMRIHPSSSPEEANRITTDHLSSLLLCSTAGAAENLAGEQAQGDVRLCGDIMYDLFLQRRDRLPSPAEVLRGIAETTSDLTEALQSKAHDGAYALCTVHRAVNTDDVDRLRVLVETLNDLDLPVLLPLHPRTEARMRDAGIRPTDGALRLLPPLGHRETLALLRGAEVAITDSGGLTREAFWSGVPSICVDDATAWHELGRIGWCTLTGANPDRIRAALVQSPPDIHPDDLFGDGNAAPHIITAIADFLLHE